MYTISCKASYTLDILAKFRGEIIRSEPAFRKKLSNLFDWNIEFRDVRVTKKGGRQQFQTVMDKSNFLAFRNSPSYGCFEGDYDVLIESYHRRTVESSNRRNHSPFLRLYVESSNCTIVELLNRRTIGTTPRS